MSDEYSLTLKWQRGEISDAEYERRRQRLPGTGDGITDDRAAWQAALKSTALASEDEASA